MTEKIRPVPFLWNGEVMIPNPRFKLLCVRQYALNDEYILAPPDSGSTASQRYYFAALREAWMNLPDEDARRYPSAEHLRKWALCKVGYADERSVVCDTPADARRLAITARALDGYAIITVSKNTIRIYTAKSQSAATMSKEERRSSEKAVLDYVAGMIGVTRIELQKHGRAA